MAAHRDSINRLYAFMNAVNGVSSPNECETALAIMKKLKEAEPMLEEPLGGEDLYSLMLHIADELGVLNPFSDCDGFMRVYKGYDDFGDISWADIIECGDGNMGPKFRVPKALIDEMEKNFIDGFQEVLIPEAEIFSAGLEQLVDSHPDSHFTLMTMEPFYYKVLSEMFSGNVLVTVQLRSMYEYAFSSEKFDLILSVPVFGGRDKAREDSPFMSRDLDMIALENLSLHLQSDGKLSIVLPARITFAGGSVKDVREFIQSMYCLTEISELPNGIFEYTGVRTYLLTITTGRTDEVTIKRYVSDTDNPRRDGINKLIAKDETFVLEDELADMGDWNVDRIFEAQDEDWIKFQESSVKKQELGSVATIFRGKAITSKDPNGSFGVVNISNIGEYEIDYSSLDHIEDEERKLTNYILKSGDLLIPARGTVIRVGVFEEQSYPCIASSNVIVIRANEVSLNPVYLKLFFDSPLGRKMLITRQQGSLVMNISYKELNNIEIPMPSTEEQKAIAEEYLKEYKVYSAAIHQAEKRWNTTLSRLQERI